MRWLKISIVFLGAYLAIAYPALAQDKPVTTSTSNGTETAIVSLPVTERYDPSAKPLSGEEKKLLASFTVPLYKSCAPGLNEIDPAQKKRYLDEDEFDISDRCEELMKSTMMADPDLRTNAGLEKVEKVAELGKRYPLALENTIIDPLKELTLPQAAQAYDKLARQYAADCDALVASLTKDGQWDEKIEQGFELENKGWAFGYADMILDRVAEAQHDKATTEQIYKSWGLAFAWRDKIMGRVLRAFAQAKP